MARIIAMQLLGKGSIYLSQDVCYKKPVYINEEVTAIEKVKEIYENKNVIVLLTEAFDIEHNLLISGEAKVMWEENGSGN